MSISLRQFRMASYLAGGFVAMRLIYAAIFGGANAPGALVFSIPEIRLSGPFRHITLFGEVTTQGLWQNILTAAPFAISILIFGFIASFIRPSQLFALAKRQFVGSHLAIAIAIGWAQLPSLIESVKRVRYAIKLRAEKQYQMLVPMLETAASRAIAMAGRIAIEQRTPADKPSLEIKDLQVGNVFVSEISLKSGELLALTGPTASGKTNLLLALSGLADELGLSVSGSVNIAGSVGYLPQQPRDSIWGPLVRDEITVLPGGEFENKAGLEIQHLSEGEAVRLVIERELARKPQILLLDEPFASLDESASKSLVHRLHSYLANGGIAVVVEHRIDQLATLNPRWYQIVDHELIEGALRSQPHAIQRLEPVVGSDPILEEKFEEIKAGSKTLLIDVKLAVRQAQAVSISGPNGSGKTSLLKTLASHRKPSEVAMIPEVVTDFFVTQSLDEELARADKIANVKPGFTKSSFDSICSELGVDFKTHPRDLSHGTQLALAISMQLSHKPKLLLIDEPVKGFDSRTKARVAETLKCVLETGTAVIFATHDQQFAENLAHQHYVIANQKLEPATGVKL